MAVANQVYERLERGTRLTVCPTVYSGGGTEPYLATLGAGLEPGIDVFWTGRVDVLPDARRRGTRPRSSARRDDRRPTGTTTPSTTSRCGFELHIGPYRGRDPHLFRHAFGVVANGMELFEASKIPIATIADYLMAPETYDAEKSWRRAIRDVAGDADLEAFALFADNVRSSCLAAEDAPALTPRRCSRSRSGRTRATGRRPPSTSGCSPTASWPPRSTCCAGPSRTGR